MNLDSCTPEQRKSIQHISSPLLISAGAGSGKTFTLTQRIAYALLPQSGPALKSVDEVLAITFTERAAAEIKARVKRTLREEGLIEEALKVDGAWISTIHGMCSRMLKAHALDLGIDPAFEVLSETERSALIVQAIDDALREDSKSSLYAALFSEYPARSYKSNQVSVASLLEQIMSKASGLRGGVSAVDSGPNPLAVCDLARGLLLAYEEIVGPLERAGDSSTAQKARLLADEALVALQEFLIQRRSGSTNLRKDYLELCSLIESCPLIGGTFKEDIKPFIRRYKQIYQDIAQQAVLGVAFFLSKELLTLAQDVTDRYTKAKRRLCKLDNDDLLSLTLEAFEKVPSIASYYSSRFSLVMVDEFQDTSQMQIDMISCLAGESCAHLCTVGDAQQSIYRFRGADVNVYEAHKATMRSEKIGALYVELTRNFRSDSDILSFVDSVFGQPSVFGKNFMSLDPYKDRVSSYRSTAPRIDLSLVVQPSGVNTGVGINDVKRQEAYEIASRFSRLRQEGYSPRDMVILLGKMTRAEVYASALREAGFECLITGGSQFTAASEVSVVVSLLEVLANPHSEKPLLDVLTSPLLSLSDDDLLVLTTKLDVKRHSVGRRSLSQGFLEALSSEEEYSNSLSLALSLFNEAYSELNTSPIGTVLLNVMVRSGWLSRLQDEGACGLACIANILKTVRYIEQLEAQRVKGLPSLAAACRKEIRGDLRDKPGALSGSSSNAVQIMTIHASKGLEFPFVALADFESTTAVTSLLIESVGGKAYASLMPSRLLDDFPSIKKNSKTVLADCLDSDSVKLAFQGIEQGNFKGLPCTQSAFRSVLAQRIHDEELAEARRKLYVGLTRASEALIVSMNVKLSSKQEMPSYTPLTDDIRQALCGAEDFPVGEDTLLFADKKVAQFNRVVLASDTRVIPETGTGCSSFCTPCYEIPQYEYHLPGRQKSRVFSYSALPAAKPVMPPGGQDKKSSCNEAAGATSLGSAFHRAAQFALETGEIPDTDRLRAYARSFSLSDSQIQRLAGACGTWFASDLFQKVLSYEDRRAEVPFYEPIGEEFLEGEIDALCISGHPNGARSAFVVDYKTGGNPEEKTDDIRNKHLLQAQCYAYALLSQGMGFVELCFVRVEQRGQGGEPQHVFYQFCDKDIPALMESILSRRYM